MTNKILRVFSIKEAREEISLRKKNLPFLVHRASYDDDSLIIESFSTNEYIATKKAELFKNANRIRL